MVDAHGPTAQAGRAAVRRAVEAVPPGDEPEERRRAEVLRWVDSGAPLFRVAPPDVPDPHLVAYVVAWDAAAGRVLLADHRKAGRWLPTGGHVEPGEDPAAAARREVLEELGVAAPFIAGLGPRPLFLTVTPTVGPSGGHTDVSLWYVVELDSRRPLAWDRAELADVRWFDLDEVLAADPARLDPGMHRFTGRLLALTMAEGGGGRRGEGERCRDASTG